MVLNSRLWNINWAPSSEFVSSSIPSWQILTAHAQPFRGARDLAFCLNVPLDSLLVWASSEGSGETARMRRLAWTFAARIGDKYQIRLSRSNSWWWSRKEFICASARQHHDTEFQKANLTLLRCFPKDYFAADVKRSKCLHATSSKMLFCMYYVGNVIYHNFSRGDVSYMFNGGKC